MSEYKCCSSCKQNKSVESFSKSKANKDGYHGHCKNCRAKYRQSNKQQIADYYADWCKSNPAKKYQSHVLYKIRLLQFLAADFKREIPNDVIVDLLNSNCAICGNKDDMTIDHIIPLSKGGLHEASNLQPLCRSCNSSKGAKVEAPPGNE